MIYLQVCSFLFPFVETHSLPRIPVCSSWWQNAAEKSFNLHIALGGIASRDCFEANGVSPAAE